MPTIASLTSENVQSHNKSCLNCNCVEYIYILKMIGSDGMFTLLSHGYSLDLDTSVRAESAVYGILLCDSNRHRKLDDYISALLHDSVHDD
jgi:hypothetical protein